MIVAKRRQSRLPPYTDLLLLVVGALILSAAALLYQRVAIYHDTGTYYIYGKHILSEAKAVLTHDPAAANVLGEDDKDYFGARSPTYSAIVYLATSRATLWGVLVLQALAAAWVLLALAKAVAPAAHARCFLILATCLTLGTGLSYFLSFAMPDVFAGLGALALLGHLAYPDRLDWTARMGLLLMVGLAASFHPTIPPVLAAAAIAGALAMLVSGGTVRRSALLCGAALGVVIAGWATGPLYRSIERKVFEHRIEAPPFLMARLLEDGTGARYLAEACAADPQRIFCQVPIHPPIDSDAFLWNRDENGTYLAVEPPQRARLRDEQWAFVAGTALSHPVEQFRISLGNWWRQLLMIEVDEPLEDPTTQTSFNLFDQTNSRPGEVRTYGWEAQLEALRTAIMLASGALVLGIALLAATARSQPDERRRVMIVVTVVVVAILVNAAITGIVSKPYPRYQSRISWLLPAILVMLSFHPFLIIRLRNLLKQARYARHKNVGN